MVSHTSNFFWYHWNFCHFSANLLSRLTGWTQADKFGTKYTVTLCFDVTRCTCLNVSSCRAGWEHKFAYLIFYRTETFCIKLIVFQQTVEYASSNKAEDLYCSPECIAYAELEQAWKYMTIRCISFHPCRSIRKQIWPCHKNHQGQPSVIIWTNLVVLEYPMLYTKF